MNAVRPLRGEEICRLMRENGHTIRSLAAKHGLTMKRVREVRDTGVSGFLADEWHFMVTGAWLSDIAGGKVVSVDGELWDRVRTQLHDPTNGPAPVPLGRRRGQVLFRKDDPGIPRLRVIASVYATGLRSRGCRKLRGPAKHALTVLAPSPEPASA